MQTNQGISSVKWRFSKEGFLYKGVVFTFQDLNIWYALLCSWCRRLSIRRISRWIPVHFWLTSSCHYPTFPAEGATFMLLQKITTSSCEVSPRTNDCFQPIKVAGCVKGARNNMSGQEKACRLVWRHWNLLAENMKLSGDASCSLEKRKIMLK